MPADFVTELSKTVSHALRHEPWLYELELDDEGWAVVDDLLAALHLVRPELNTLSADDLVCMIASADKQRHEMQDGKIRALYGHSVQGKLNRMPGVPPKVL